MQRLDSVDSTNSWALEHGDDLPHGTLVLAREQTGGRGTQGRRWSSPRDEGVWASLVLVPPTPLVSPAALSIALGLAVHAATESFGLEPVLKWPNDVLIAGAKLAGLLVERRGTGPFVCGLGWNVTTRRFPAELEAERAVTSLVRAGAEVDVQVAERALVRELGRWVPRAWSEPESLLAPYLAASGFRLGDAVRVLGPEDEQLEGSLQGFGFREGVVISTPARTSSLALEHCRGLTKRP